MKKFKLNPIAREWVKALRSGKYRQAKDVLTMLNFDGKVVGHCCLGVLCELAVAKGIVKAKPTAISECVAYGGKKSLLPKKVQKWAGMKTNDGDYDPKAESLAGLNDSGKSFKFIARLIEQKAKDLFVE